LPLLKSRLPSIYHHVLGIADLEYPDERFATCSSCLNCQSSKSPYISTKCCTYRPSLPNYLVGGILADSGSSGAAGRARVRTVIASGIGLTPYGLLRPASLAALRPERVSEDRLPTRAEAESRLCTFYDAGHCTVWNYREHLCSTYFCYSVGGTAGQAFWRVVNEYLRLVEREFCLHALATLGWPVEQLRLGNPLRDWEPPLSAAAKRRRRLAWRHWAGREVDLFVESHRVIATIDRAMAATLLGWKGALLEGRLSGSLANFAREVVPERLCWTGAVRIQPGPANDVQVQVDGHAPALVPRVVATFLPQFDGRRATSDVVRLAASLGIDVTRHIGPLLAAGVLIEP